jgi:uncharacterized protein GlcG (DUF336 family)
MNLPLKRQLTLEAAKLIAAAAVEEAHKHQWTLVIAVVDAGAHLIYLERMDGAQIASVVVAQDKAATAVRFRRSTKTLEEAVAGGRTVVMKLAGATPIEGGLPISVGGELVGGIGVSGGTSAQDGQVASAALRVLDQIS